jgi:glucuronoxylan 4-O-methyltransferase
MKKQLKKYINKYRALLSIELARVWPSHHNISKMKQLNHIQLSTDQLKAISTAITRKAPCKLLIFGLGNDSAFWLKLNRGGDTIFLEDNEEWLQQITKKIKGITAFIVDYKTLRTDWKKLLENQSLLDMSLPQCVENEEWDIILVDAPNGWNDQTPGRMKSIYHSSRLIKNSGDIFVHDCDREIETVYCDKYLKKDNFVNEIEAEVGDLRHYCMTK